MEIKNLDKNTINQKTFKHYPHLDKFITQKAFSNFQDQFFSYSDLCKYLELHIFLPFLQRNEKTPKFLNLPGKRIRTKRKKRTFRYPSHKDGLIHYIYGNYLQGLYEEELSKNNLQECIVAYRRIPLLGTSRNKSVKHFANEVFDFIKTQKRCTVLAYDIKGYFDNINHHELKKSWQKLLGVKFLNKGEYRLFKSITRYNYFDLNRIKQYVKNYSLKTIYTKKRGQICSYDEFRQIIKSSKEIGDKSLYNTNKSSKGIPQGSPLSPLLSNIYLLEFDKEISLFVKKYNGFYRRYCDDIIIIIPPNKVKKIESKIYSLLNNPLLLEIKKEKTEKTKFIKKRNGFKTFKESYYDKKNDFDPNVLKIEKGGSLQYLGWEYNGNSVSIRKKTLAKFYRKLKNGTSRITWNNINSKNKTFPKKKILKKFTFNSKNIKFDTDKKHTNFLDYLYYSSDYLPQNFFKKQDIKTKKIVSRIIRNIFKKHEKTVKETNTT